MRSFTVFALFLFTMSFNFCVSKTEAYDVEYYSELSSIVPFINEKVEQAVKDLNNNKINEIGFPVVSIESNYSKPIEFFKKTLMDKFRSLNKEFVQGTNIRIEFKIEGNKLENKPDFHCNLKIIDNKTGNAIQTYDVAGKIPPDLKQKLAKIIFMPIPDNRNTINLIKILPEKKAEDGVQPEITPGIKPEKTYVWMLNNFGIRIKGLKEGKAPVDVPFERKGLELFVDLSEFDEIEIFAINNSDNQVAVIPFLNGLSWTAFAKGNFALILDNDKNRKNIEYKVPGWYFGGDDYRSFQLQSWTKIPEYVKNIFSSNVESTLDGRIVLRFHRCGNGIPMGDPVEDSRMIVPGREIKMKTRIVDLQISKEPISEIIIRYARP